MENQDRKFQEAMRMAASREGQQLLRLLQQSGGPQLQQAMENASRGDFSGAKQVLSGLMGNPEARSLLEKMGGIYGQHGK